MTDRDRIAKLWLEADYMEIIYVDGASIIGRNLVYGWVRRLEFDENGKLLVDN